MTMLTRPACCRILHQKNRVKFGIFTRESVKKSEGTSKFPGKLKVKHGVAQTMFVKVSTHFPFSQKQKERNKQQAKIFFFSGLWN